MEISPFHPYSWDILYNPYMFLPYFHKPENYVHWRETPDSHVFSADLPGVRKEDIKVELEDLKYLIIRTEAGDNTVDPPRRFMKKFRLPGRIDLDGISAGYEDGVLTVTVPRRANMYRISHFGIRLFS
ncbi:15.4 kDa class V heat shock protein-like isoform X2 [Chenopodium quinoa]|uniref:15.4 kDa class V heat shock protein-like isoform X2 n=1 Tax=Chenopodium quinoa TaxID=63459 RepID=UPI000B78CA29|nr:15.4 kDa class V heat shock protein-like isoform X2 [Chenopodium quinoa]